MQKNSKQDVSSYLQHLRKMQESKVRFLAEADPVVPASPPAAPQVDALPDQGTVDPNIEDPNVSQEATADIQKGSITLEMVIDKFNTIRAGKSFKDKSIKQQMMQYFEKLSDDEKVALYAFLKGISQIVSGEFTGYNPVSPSDVGASAAAPGVPPAEGAPAQAAPPAEAPAAAAPAPAPEPAPAPPPPAPTKKVIKTIKPNIIKRQPAPTNPTDGNAAAPIPITPKVR
jgi:hypothetical protein